MPSHKITLVKILAALSIIVLLTTTYLFLPQTFFSLDNRLRDFLFILHGPQPASSNIVIIDIDEKSLAKEGQWPWPRNKVAQLIQNLSEAQAGIIGLDIFFAEEDQRSPLRIASQLSCNVNQLPDYDLELANTISTTPTIGGYLFTFDGNSSSNPPLIPAVFIEKGLTNRSFIMQANQLIMNTPVLQRAFYSSGFLNTTPDEGGMIRRVPLLIRYDDMLYPSLSLEMVRLYTQTQKVIVQNSISGVEYIGLGKYHILTDRHARLQINYSGKRHSYHYLSASDILSNNFSADEVTGKFVLVGTSSLGLADLRATPFDTQMPGVEIHATIIDNLINQNFISSNDTTFYLDLGIIILVIITMFILTRLVATWMLLPLSFLLLFGGYKFFSYLLFSEGLVLNLLFPLIAFIISLLTALFIDYLTILKQKKEVMSIFSKKVSQQVMEDLIAHNATALLTPRNKEVSIFFSDIRSFTHISERLGNPERVIAMLNTYMTPMVETITAHQGTIDKFIGDAIMAYWNAPVEVDEHADKAVQSALEQLKLLKVLNQVLQEKFAVTINIGIGIHTGEVTIGEMGSSGRSDYTIIGDNVNLASRLEGLTKVYGARIIISQETKMQLTGTYILRSLDIVQVKGKDHAVEIFEVFMDDNIDFEALSTYEKALMLYRSKELSKAHTLFKDLSENNDDLLYKLYCQRCESALKHGVENFKVITKMQSK